MGLKTIGYMCNLLIIIIIIVKLHDFVDFFVSLYWREKVFKWCKNMFDRT